MRSERIQEFPATLMRTGRDGGTGPEGFPSLSGGASYCCNLRYSDSGGLESVREAAVAATLANDFAALDERDGRTFIFTTDSRLYLRLETELHDGKPVARMQTMARLPAKVKDYARAGEFFILHLADGTLFYILWEADRESYSVLGQLPDFGSIEAKRTGNTEFSVPVAAARFPSPIEDPRSVGSASFGTAPGAAVLSAYSKATAEAASAGYWSRSAAVRLAYRLWDGTLLHVSAPVAAGELGSSLPPRTQLPMVHGDKGFTGTAESILTLPVFRIAVALTRPLPEAWRSVVRYVELWVSREPETLYPGSQPRTGYYQSGGAHFLGITLSGRDDGELAASVLEGEMELAARLPFGTTGEITLRRPASPVRSSPGGLESRSPAGKASCMEAHGDFLHICESTSSLPLPEIPAGGAGDCLCRVSVEVATPSGTRRVGSSAYVGESGGMINPVIWYPSLEAVSATVSMESAATGKRYEQEFRLTRAASGENASYYVAAGREAIQLPEVEALTSFADTRGSAERTGAVVTMRRGNPFVESGRSASPGGKVLCMAAQPTGGGAYTRQYIYLFTDAGVSALTHDSSGRHCTLRPIAACRAGSRGRISPLPQGVAALSDDGELLLLADSRAKILFRGLKGYGAMLHHPRHGELWLLPADGKGFPLAFCLDRGLQAGEASVRSTAPVKSVGEHGGVPLFIDADGSLCLLEDENGERLRAEWESGKEVCGSQEPVVLNLRIHGEEVDAAGGLWLHSGEGGVASPVASLLGNWSMEGEYCGDCSLGIMLPARPTQVTVRAEGRFERLEGCVIREVSARR